MKISSTKTLWTTVFKTTLSRVDSNVLLKNVSHKKYRKKILKLVQYFKLQLLINICIRIRPVIDTIICYKPHHSNIANLRIWITCFKWGLLICKVVNPLNSLSLFALSLLISIIIVTKIVSHRLPNSVRFPLTLKTTTNSFSRNIWTLHTIKVMLKECPL